MNDALASDWIAISRSVPFQPYACKADETERETNDLAGNTLCESERRQRDLKR